MSDEVTGWRQVRGVPPLADNALHIWFALTGEHEPALRHYAGLLSSAELQRAGRLRLEQLKTRFIISRGLLRTLLGTYLDCRPASIPITCTLQGKPCLPASFSSAALSFNLSHSRVAILFAVRRGKPVGIDVEYMRDQLDFASLAKRFFSVREYRAISSLEGLQRKTAFYRYWTRKEAYLKATGKGLAGLQETAGEQHELRAAAHDWSVIDLRVPEPSYAGAVAFAGESAQTEALLLTPDGPGI